MVRCRGEEGWRLGLGLHFRDATAWTVLLLGLLAAGCGPDQLLDAGPGDTPVDATGTSSPSVNPAEVEVATASPDLNGDEILLGLEDWSTPRYMPPDAPDGTLQLVACRWLGPDRWEAELDWQSTPAPTFDQPFGVPIVVGHVTDDEENWGNRATAATAILGGNGRFKMAMGSTLGFGIGNSRRFAGWWNATPLFQLDPTGQCAAYLFSDDIGDPDFVELQLDAQPFDSSLAEPGTIESLAAAVPVTPEWVEHPMAALAQLLNHDDIPVDRFHLAPDQAIQGIDIKHTEDCLIVVIDQSGGQIQQSQGCEATPLLSLVEGQRIPADGWTVVVDGEPELVEAVQPFRFIGAVDRAGAPLMDLAEAEDLAGVGPDSGRVPSQVLDTFTWQGETITVSFTEQEFCCVIYETAAETFTSGGEGVACRDWAISLSFDNSRGFLLVVVSGQRSATVTIDGQTRAIPLQATRIDGLRAALIDSPFDHSIQADYKSAVEVLEPDGTPSACIQE